MNPLMRICGIDYGENRTGIAVSDPLGWTAQGLETVSGGMGKAISRIANLIQEMGITTIVVGYPLNMNGTAGYRAERTDTFIEALRERISDDRIEIVRLDERLTSREAAQALAATGVRPTSRDVREKGKIDILAATFLLQSYLDRVNKD